MSAITMSLCVREHGDSSGRWMYSRAKSVESAVRGAIDRCTDHGYAIGESTVRVWDGEHAYPTNAAFMVEYVVTTRHGVILSMEATK